jgi:hypothetical protein
MTLMGKPADTGYLHQGQIGLLEEPLGQREALPQHKLVRTGACRPQEQLRKVIRAETYLLGQRL